MTGKLPARQAPATPPESVARPRPLALHLALQTVLRLSSKSALPSLKAGLLPWRPELRNQASELAKKLDSYSLEAISEAVDREVETRLREFAAGVGAYNDFERQPADDKSATIWRNGSTRLLHYSLGKTGRTKPGAPILAIPSLVNRSHILDLAPSRSVMRALADRGLDPYLIDWGEPGAEEKSFGLTEYVAGRLESALDHLGDRQGRRIGLLGYCMGGLLALALAQRKPKRVSAIALLATPWDFHQPNNARGAMIRALKPQFEHLIATHRGLPVDALQAMFLSFQPFRTVDKFRTFGKIAKSRPISEKTRLFVALEDWLNDGVPLSAGVARECLFGLYSDNNAVKGRWRVAGRPVRPGEVSQPALIVIPTDDRIVPPESARPLAGSLPNFECWDIETGHIGMVAGRGVSGKLHEPLGIWLRAHA